MRLYPLITDREAVNILKLLYNHEVLQKHSYTLKLSDAAKSLSIGNRGNRVNSAKKLSDYGLIALDAVEKDHVMSITTKGKEFIEIFDQLVELLQPRQAGKRSISIKYELTNQEKKILVLAYKISKESGSDFIPLKMLVEELYPVNQTGKSGVVSRYVTKLEEIGLMQKKRLGRTSEVSVTENGFKTIREQYLKGIMH